MEDGRQQIGEFLWPDHLIGTATHGAKVEELAPTHVAAADSSPALTDDALGDQDRAVVRSCCHD
jgi:hypothetical protein